MLEERIEQLVGKDRISESGILQQKYEFIKQYKVMINNRLFIWAKNIPLFGEVTIKDERSSLTLES